MSKEQELANAAAAAAAHAARLRQHMKESRFTKMTETSAPITEEVRERLAFLFGLRSATADRVSQAQR